MVTQIPTAADAVDEYQRQIESDLEQTQRTLKEVSLMLEQSQVELSKLTQRNASVTGHLQQVQAQFDSLPRVEIRSAYNSALDTQQRLLVMRGQLEKLQSDQSYLKRLITLFDVIRQFLQTQNRSQRGGKGARSNMAILEMVINAQESERQRLSRQMHDGPAQALSNFIVQTEIATRLFDIDPARAKEELNNLKTSALSTFQQVRSFIFELRPMMLDDLGLFPTMRRYVDAYKEQTGIDVSLSMKGQLEKRLEPYLEVMIFRALQELLGNVVRHNQDFPGKLQVTVQIFHDENLIRVSVSDNGKGLNPETVGKSSGIGLKLIRDRVEMLGGQLEIDSAIGQGCRISFQVPYFEESSVEPTNPV